MYISVLNSCLQKTTNQTTKDNKNKGKNKDNKKNKQTKNKNIRHRYYCNPCTLFA